MLSPVEHIAHKICYVLFVVMILSSTINNIIILHCPHTQDLLKSKPSPILK